jgi:hypothetical protein
MICKSLLCDLITNFNAKLDGFAFSERNCLRLASSVSDRCKCESVSRHGKCPLIESNVDHKTGRDTWFLVLLMHTPVLRFAAAGKSRVGDVYSQSIISTEKAKWDLEVGGTRFEFRQT